MTIKTILHPTDFSESADQALELGIQLALTRNATLHLFHAATLHDERATNAQDKTLETTAARAQEIAARFGGDGALKLTTSEGRAVLPFDAVMQVVGTSAPDVIVMGTHGRSGFSKLLMGSTAEKVLRHAPCSVLTVKSGARLPTDGQFRKLLVPVDFSDWAGRALDAARALRSADSTIYLLHVVEPVPPMYYAGNVSSRFELDPELRERIESNLRTWSGDLPGAKDVISEGSPALEVARVAEETRADLVVMSTKGLTGVDHLLVGSVTERVCRFSTVPVLTVR